jgi:hypothetical protein
MTQSKEKEELVIERTKKLLVVYLIPAALCITLATGFTLKNLSEEYKWWVICFSIVVFAISGYLIGRFVKEKVKKDFEKY